MTSNGRARHRIDWGSPQLYYWPAPTTPMLTCRALVPDANRVYFRCGANYIDDEPSRAAHAAVFGHYPSPDAEP